jgi:hypothetical protein
MWLTLGEVVPSRERQSIESPKLMLAIAWNPNGFHVLKPLPNVGKFNN